MSKTLNYDNLNSVDPARVGHGTFACVAKLQHLTPEQQIAACAVLLQLQCRRFNAHVGTVLTVANNIIDRTIHMTPQLQAAMAFVEKEMRL